MARRLFFVPEIRREHAEIAGEEAQHLTRVLRVEAGQRFEISDNHALYLAEVETARKSLVTFRVIEKLPVRPAGADITLAASIFKFDHFEWMLEKVTELGVTTIVPVAAERSERGLEQAAPKRLERWRRIVLESSQQCRRARLPEIRATLRLRDFLPETFPNRYVLEEQSGAPSLLRVPHVAGASALLLGPEGGWADREREAIQAAGWTAVSLGTNILRAETAGIAALALLGARE
jgi:16S rRNA (uracil1498-N3)-methyltransferase